MVPCLQGTMLHEVKDIANGRYRLGEPLGEGGMAIVYQAHDELLQVDRAVKLLAPALSHREKVRQRFMAEARTMARLRHPNIVPVFDVGEEGGVPYIVMALIPGGNLAERVQAEGGLSCVESLAMIKGALAGLAVVHEQGVVHRDIKPQNVLLDLDGAPLLTDFGIAQTDFDERNLTRTGAVMGTMAYMPPEQRQSAKSVTASSDIYAVGAMLYALLTNKLPFDLYAKENQDRLLGDIPEPVREVIARACAYSTADRYATAADMQDALHSAQAPRCSRRRRRRRHLEAIPGAPAAQPRRRRTARSEGPRSGGQAAPGSLAPSRKGKPRAWARRLGWPRSVPR